MMDDSSYRITKILVAKCTCIKNCDWFYLEVKGIIIKTIVKMTTLLLYPSHSQHEGNTNTYICIVLPQLQNQNHVCLHLAWPIRRDACTCTCMPSLTQNDPECLFYNYLIQLHVSMASTSPHCLNAMHDVCSCTHIQ